MTFFSLVQFHAHKGVYHALAVHRAWQVEKHYIRHVSDGYIFVSRCNRLFGRTVQYRVGFLPQPGELFIRHVLVVFIRSDLFGIPLSHPGNGVLRVVAIDHRHIVAFEVVEVARRQHGKGGFATPPFWVEKAT